MTKQEIQHHVREIIKEKAPFDRNETGAYYSLCVEIDDLQELSSVFTYFSKKLRLQTQGQIYHEFLAYIQGSLDKEMFQSEFQSIQVNAIIKKASINKKNVKYIRLNEKISEYGVLNSDLATSLNGLESRLTLEQNCNNFVDELSHLINFDLASQRQYEYSRKTAVGHHIYQVICQGNCHGSINKLSLNTYSKDGFIVLQKILLETGLSTYSIMT